MSVSGYYVQGSGITILRVRCNIITGATTVIIIIIIIITTAMVHIFIFVVFNVLVKIIHKVVELIGARECE